jgi:hypothetical protein
MEQNKSCESFDCCDCASSINGLSHVETEPCDRCDGKDLFKPIIPTEKNEMDIEKELDEVMCMECNPKCNDVLKKQCIYFCGGDFKNRLMEYTMNLISTIKTEQEIEVKDKWHKAGFKDGGKYVLDRLIEDRVIFTDGEVTKKIKQILKENDHASK